MYIVINHCWKSHLYIALCTGNCFITIIRMIIYLLQNICQSQVSKDSTNGKQNIIKNSRLKLQHRPENNNILLFSIILTTTTNIIQLRDRDKSVMEGNSMDPDLETHKTLQVTTVRWLFSNLTYFFTVLKHLFLYLCNNIFLKFKFDYMWFPTKTVYYVLSTESTHIFSMLKKDKCSDQILY